MMGPGYGYMDAGFMSWMAPGSLVFWLSLVVIAVLAIVRLGRPAVRGGDAKAILDERLARGDIDAEEYGSRRALLGGR